MTRAKISPMRLWMAAAVLVFVGCQPVNGPPPERLVFEIGGTAYRHTDDIEAVLDRAVPQAESVLVLFDPASHRAREVADEVLVALVQRFPNVPGRLGVLGTETPEDKGALRVVVRLRRPGD